MVKGKKGFFEIFPHFLVVGFAFQLSEVQRELQRRIVDSDGNVLHLPVHPNNKIDLDFLSLTKIYSNKLFFLQFLNEICRWLKRPWLKSLRGKNEFSSFVSMGEKKLLELIAKILFSGSSNSLFASSDINLGSFCCYFVATGR